MINWLNVGMAVAALAILWVDHRLNKKMHKLEKRIVNILEKIESDETKADWWKDN